MVATRPSRYEYATLSRDDWGETFEREACWALNVSSEVVLRGLTIRVMPAPARELSQLYDPQVSMSSHLEIAAYIGLDWADQQHVIRLRAEGSTQIEARVLDQKPESLRAWVQELRQRFPGRRVAIALEQSRGSLLYALMNVDF